MCFSMQDTFAKQSHIKKGDKIFKMANDFAFILYFIDLTAVLLLWPKTESECLLIKGAICKILLVRLKEN